MAILASRPAGAWVEASGTVAGAGAEDGSPVDRILLWTHGPRCACVDQAATGMGDSDQNESMDVAFLLYCALSIVWSDFPAIALKRWIRACGGVMMILVVLSQQDPVAALATVVRRAAYVLVPFSVLLIRVYIATWGRYDAWTGAQMIAGVTTDKNALGRLCLIAGLFIVWELITAKGNTHIHHDKLNRLISVTILAITLWLLKISDSATSLVSFIVGSCTLVVLGVRYVDRVKHLGIFIIVTVSLAVFIVFTFGLAEDFAAGLGRNLTLTTRTFIWDDLLRMNTNPVGGVGYDSFWLGDRLALFVQKLS